MSKKLLAFIPLIILFLCTHSANATISIDSIKNIASTCTNNGSISIFATTTTGTMLYTVTAGPVTFPVQTSNVFSSLPPGDYTIELSNTSNDRFVILETIAGNYQLPDFFPLVTAPDCPDNSTGIIDGNPTFSTGLTPYSWELIPPSELTKPVQPDPVFNNLPRGTYTLRMTDACNNIQTKSIILFAPPNTMTPLGDFISFIGCDTAVANLIILVSDERPPYKVTYTAGGVTYSTDTAKQANSGTLQLMLPAANVSYGDAFTDITVTNACGTQLFIPRVSVCPFVFSEYYNISPGPNCSTAILTTFSMGEQGLCGNLQPKFPLTITIKDALTNNTIETKTYQDQFSGNFSTVAMAPGGSYNVSFTDGCNTTFTHTVTTLVKERYVDYSSSGQQTMLDSTAITYIYAHGFPSTGTTLTVTGGPGSAHSTKKGYQYTEDYVYPKAFTLQASSDSSLICPIYNTAPGKYYYTITDTCGTVYLDSFIVNSTDVSDFYFKYDYVKGCAGESGLQFEFLHNTFSTFKVTDIKSATLIHLQSVANLQNPFSGAINNLKATDYQLAIDYYGGGIDRSLTNTLVDLFTALDTIRILPYQNPSLKSSSSVLCNGNLSLVLTADSSKGIAPYQYEIISGPQTFPPQPGNLFQLIQKGLYRVRLTDKCGNSTATDVTVDDLIFPPLSKIGNSCINGAAELTFGASIYFSYTWTKPGGDIFKGDTLLIAPITPADTGIYTISRLTAINGCTSEQSTTYRLTSGAQDSTAVSICTGQSYTFGNKTITLPGIYRDTIATTFCDSISILNLTVYDFKKDSSVVAICKGQSFLFGSRSLSQAGIYRDTLTTANCDSISILDLIITDYKRDSLAVSICTGQSYLFGTTRLSQPGIYKDTLQTTNCDSISTLKLIVYPLPLVKAQSDKYTAVKGETIHLTVSPAGLASYLWSSQNSLSNTTISNPTSVVNISALYKVLITDENNCTNSDSLFIQLVVDSITRSCTNTEIYIPNAFTPNNDNKNDFFKIAGINNISYRGYFLIIFNRYGQKVFESNDPLKCWDGIYRNKPAGQGNYVYYFRFTCEDGNEFIRKGNIILLR